MISDLPFHMAICLQCGKERLCYPNGICRCCILIMKLHEIVIRSDMIKLANRWGLAPSQISWGKHYE